MTLRGLWDDIRPSAVYTVLTTLLLSTWTGIVIVTHGLKWWQQAILAFLTALLCLWAGVATYFARKHPHQVNTEEQKPDPKQATRSEANVPLPDHIDALAKEVFTFLGECGEENPPSLSYIVKVHDGFMLTLHERIERVSYELGWVGVVDFELGELLRINANAFSYDAIKKIAEALLAVKHKLELNSYRKATLTVREIRRLTTDELNEKLKDPWFAKQVDVLLSIKPPSP
jgi:hypothetical protein